MRVADRLIAKVLEARQVGIVYHFTSVYKAIGILDDMALRTHRIRNLHSGEKFEFVPDEGDIPVRTDDTIQVSPRYEPAPDRWDEYGREVQYPVADVHVASLTRSKRPLFTVDIGDVRIAFDGNKMSDVYKLVPFAAAGFPSGPWNGSKYDEDEVVVLFKGKGRGGAPVGGWVIKLRPGWIKEIAIFDTQVKRVSLNPARCATYIDASRNLLIQADRLGIPVRSFDKSGRSYPLTPEEQRALLAVGRKAPATLDASPSPF